MMKGMIKMARKLRKNRTNYLHRAKRPSAFKTPGGEITEVDLLRLSDKTGLSYYEIRNIYESMKSSKPVNKADTKRK
jgi:hypothetical protein